MLCFRCLYVIVKNYKFMDNLDTDIYQFMMTLSISRIFTHWSKKIEQSIDFIDGFQYVNINFVLLSTIEMFVDRNQKET